MRSPPASQPDLSRRRNNDHGTMREMMRVFSSGVLSRILNAIWKFLLALVLTSALSSCQREKADFSQQVVALGTVVDFTFYNIDDATGHAAIARMQTVLSGLHNRWHPWQPSEITRIDAELAQGHAVETDEETARVIGLAQQFYHQTGGLFNPGVGALVRLWGFFSDDPPTGPPPSAPEVTQALEQAGAFPSLQIDGTRLTNARRDLQMDLGALAQGYAVQRCAEILREMGIANAVINAGGDLMVLGKHGDRPWRIGIRHPRQAGVLAAVEIESDESIITSGDYERFFDYEGKRYHHIIDPRTGYPAQGAIAVTVLHASPTVADAASTALLIAGPAQWRTIAKALGVEHVMLIDAQLNVYLTPSMRERVKISPGQDVNVIVQPNL